MYGNILVTGGTGSFGQAFIKKIIDNNDINEIRIFSRDEDKQNSQRLSYDNPKLKFYLGDIRDYESLKRAVIGTDFIFHAAALKHVPSCEFFPLEALKTNVLGCNNVINLAIENNVKKVVALSTDKAVYPINAMGQSKALMEKLILSNARIYKNSSTKFIITRYGNVMASRGSVIPIFSKKLLSNKVIDITNPNMTRFLMSLDEAVNLVIFAIKTGESGDLFVQKSPSSTVLNLAKALSKYFIIELKYNIIGPRLGEKEHETLVTKEEMSSAIDQDKFYRIPLLDNSFNYEKYLSIGDTSINSFEEYNSYNTYNLNELETYEKMKEISDVLNAF